MANEYSTRAELLATLNLTGETFANDDIDVALEAASRAIDAACDRRFYADSDATQIRYFSADSMWVLPVHDVVTITTVATDVDGDGTFETTLTANTDFFAEPLNAAADGWPYTRLVINPQTSSYFPVGTRTVKITGKYGWTAVPVAIEQATRILASKLMRRSREAPFGVVSAGIDTGVVMRIAIQDPDVRFLIDPYRRLQAG